MAEGGDVEWELSKENIQPLRQGRVMSTLQKVLSQQQDGASCVINQQRQAFESELRMYDGDDPLDVWDRYVKWTQQTFPQGGKESNFAKLLEQAVTRFTEEVKYHNDPRYVELWITFARICPEPIEIFSYLQAQGIGKTRANFYIAWSEEYEKHDNSRKADMIFQEGFKNCAEPHDKLLQFHMALQTRVSRQVIMKVKDDDSDDELEKPKRSSLVDLKYQGKKKAIAPIRRTGPAIRNISGGLQLQGDTAFGNITNSRLVIFDENNASSSGPSEPNLELWGAPPTATAKENVQMPQKWCDVKMPLKPKVAGTVTPLPPSKPTFQPFVEESDQPPTIYYNGHRNYNDRPLSADGRITEVRTPCNLSSTVNTVLSARRPCREETPLRRLQEQQQQQKEAEAGTLLEQSMYCKELLFSGVSEFCFEELHGEWYFKKKAGASQGVSGSKDTRDVLAAN